MRLQKQRKEDVTPLLAVGFPHSAARCLNNVYLTLARGQERHDIHSGNIHAFRQAPRVRHDRVVSFPKCRHLLFTARCPHLTIHMVGLKLRQVSFD